MKYLIDVIWYTISTKAYNRIFIGATLMFIVGSTNLKAQAPEFSGVWVLKEKTSLSGTNYSNGLPKQISLTTNRDTLKLERINEGAFGDYTIVESLSLDGKPNTILRSNNVTRTSVFKKGIQATDFSIEVNYKDGNTGKQTSADFIEQWKLDERELVIEKNAKDPDGNSWRMKGVYEQKTAEEVATGKGIRFFENATWEQVKAQAKKESKFIFVDCFATWCKPCKEMEKEIFPLNIVGSEMNNHFIAVRVQMDTTKKDDENIKAWYETGHDFLIKYNIVGYPTFLFFDADGNIVHKGLGAYKADEFIELLKDARNPNKQYYALLKSYEKEKLPDREKYNLVLAAKQLGETKQAEKVLFDYKKSYLDKLFIDSLLSEKYLKLAYDFQDVLIRKDGSKGSFFKLFYKKGNEVDRYLSAPGFASFHVNGIVAKEEISDKVYKNGKPVSDPQWEKIKGNIKTKYPKLDAEQLILTAQITFYRKSKAWKNQIKAVVQKAEKFGPLSLGQSDGSGSDNTIADALLPHCDNQEILNKAVGWMEQIIHSNAYMYPIPMVYGNYGGILYKAGKRNEGIEAFEKHLNAIGYKTPADIDKDPRFKPKVEILDKMKRGEKIDSTWDASDFN